jgi:hypothetical protein
MAQQAIADPWGQPNQSTQMVATTMDPDPEGKVTLTCPHCGTELKPHHDTVGSLHCYGAECVNCCFLPPDETSAGKVRGKFEAKPCPSAQKVGGF